MKFKYLLTGLAASLLLITSCQQKEEDLGTPRIKVNPTQLSLDQGETSNPVELTATRDWFISSKPEWAALSVEEGKGSTKPQSITVSVNANAGNDRTGEIIFSIGLAKTSLTINQKGAQGEIKMGSGTLDDPFTVVGAIAYVEGLGKDVTSDANVYIKGKVASFKDDETFSKTGSYGNATFYISDDGENANTFYCYRIKYLGNKAFKTGQTDIALKDDVVICGKVVNYKGNTPETAQNTAYLYSLNGKTESGSVEPDDPSKVQQITCAEFISKADPNTTYRLVGKVTSSVNTQYCSFDMNDGTATVVVWTVNNKDEWSSKVKQGGTVTVRGKYLRYESSGNVKHEMVDAYIEAFEEGSVQPGETVTGTVAQTIASADGTAVVIPESLVMAISKQGLVVSDGTANVYLFFDSKNNETVPDVAIGDKVKIEAEKATYGGVPEFKAPKVTKLSSGNPVSYPEPKDLNPVASSYNSNVTEFVKMTGTLKLSGNYVNIEIDGVDSASKMGSVSAPIDALGASSFDNKKVTVKGYFSGITGSGKYINVVATEIASADPNAKYCTVAPASISVKADETSASFSISANAAWEASSDNADFTVEPASGSGDATVKVNFAANSGDAARTAHINVVCAEAGVNAVVTVTQAKPSSGEALTISIDFTQEDANLPQASANGKQDGTYTVDGYTFTLHAADKYYQAKSNDSYYLLIGKKDSYIQFPVVEGKALTKVKFLTGAAASENVIADIAKADGTRLNINNDKLKKGTEYTWEVPGEPGVAYRFVVTNAYNAQFQNLTLTYE